MCTPPPAAVYEFEFCCFLCWLLYMQTVNTRMLGGGGPISLWWWGRILSSLYTVCPTTVVYNMSGHWLYPIYFYAILSLVKNGLVLPSFHFPTEKGKEPISLSSICSGNYCKVPTVREALPIGVEWYAAIQGPDKRRPCFSLSVFSHVQTYWPRCLPIHVLMGKRERQESGGERRMKAYQVTPDNKTWTWRRRKETISTTGQYSTDIMWIYMFYYYPAKLCFYYR